MTTYHVEIIEDSIARNTRLTTMAVTMPRLILADSNSHRMLSRNSASSRAIPVKKRIDSVRKSPFMPEAFSLNIKGMQAGDPLDYEDQQKAQAIWLSACESACRHAEELEKLGVHKQWANRLTEVFSWTTVVVTATDWDNFFNLRTHPDAQPEFVTTAKLMKATMAESTPKQLGHREWHLPYVRDDERHLDPDILPKISSARCARVSYLTQDGVRDIEKDLELFERLKSGGHISPLEHAAMVASDDHLMCVNPSNFRKPWLQYRKMFPGEDVFRG